MGAGLAPRRGLKGHGQDRGGRTGEEAPSLKSTRIGSPTEAQAWPSMFWHQSVAGWGSA